MTASIVLLNQSYCLLNIDIQGERILNHFNLRLVTFIKSYHELVDKLLLLDKWHRRNLLFAFVIVLLLFFLLLLLCLLLFLATAILFNWLLKDQVEFNTVVLAEIARYWDLNDRRIILEIEEQLIKMHIDGFLSWIKLCNFVF